MSRIGNPLAVPELDLRPEPTGGIELSSNMQQVLSALCGFWRNKRVLLKASPSGILMVASAQEKEIIHVTEAVSPYNYKGPNVPCTELMVMGHPDNTARIWVRPHAVATVNNAWPLVANAVKGFTITNLNMLHIFFPAGAGVAIIAYTD